MSEVVTLSDRHRAVIAEARAVADAVDHVAMEADESSTLHPDVAQALRDSDLSELMVPASHGGRFDEIDGANRLHFCGAYWGWGFHEDGVRSAARVAARLGSRWLEDAA